MARLNLEHLQHVRNSLEARHEDLTTAAARESMREDLAIVRAHLDEIDSDDDPDLFDFTQYARALRLLLAQSEAEERERAKAAGPVATQ